MLIQFKKLIAKCFKNHKSLEVEMKDILKLSGPNGAGKSSIVDLPAWVLFGTDALGTKLDPTPTNYDFDEVYAELLLQVDDSQYLFGRGIEKGKNTFYINGVPSKATEFNNAVYEVLQADSADLFLSLYNPSYFPTMHWQDQRNMILKWVSAPANSEVFKHLPELQAKALGEAMKKHSLADLEKIQKKNKTDMEKQHIAAISRVKTLQEQLDAIPEQDTTKAKTELQEIESKLAHINDEIKRANKVNADITRGKAKLEALKNQYNIGRQKLEKLKDEPLQDSCNACGQTLTDEARQAVEDFRTKQIKELTDEVNAFAIEYKEITDQLKVIVPVDVDAEMEQQNELMNRKQRFAEVTQEQERRAILQQQIEQAKEQEQSTLDSKNNSVFVLDAIKAFSAKEAELQAEKVQDLFTTLSIRLFNENKTDGELKPTFEIELDGKPYSKLSVGEKIRAGLELIEVLQKQSGIITPVAVDNYESITSNVSTLGQLIYCVALPGQGLNIEPVELEGVTV